MAEKYLLVLLNKFIRKSKIVARIFFRIKVRGGERIYWDFTTFALKSSLSKFVNSNTKVLEIGTGPYSILSLYLKKKFGCDITACDINEEYTENAKICAEYNNVSIKIILSDLFGSIKDKYDIIFFNSVYIRHSEGIEKGIYKIHKYETDWCGGESGTEIINRFLSEARGYLSKNGKIFLGFNPVYLSSDEMISLCRKHNYETEMQFKKIINPSVVYLLKSKSE